ncbi:molybdenum cofactor guanylyltransferase [Candidatus Formimonas warabiya]|uniref:Probable molybdenum cofactor guanylyltransferase n=1 Tax=Formimonas warabiya TaxID=1761012 RepID=A0A3G1KMC8_FORW1|nr:molybdenum cofactor guanylyltransferase [Candidatus Formimonas warabiya]ATW23636.1 hypothetical protein DCMF_01415 [Candidatus Formimonas warabiya]
MMASGVILAGGKSTRMGMDKTLITINNEPIIHRIVGELKSVLDELIIVSNEVNKFGLAGTREIMGAFPEKGPLGGIHAGLTAAAHEYSFVVAGDMPWCDKNLAQLLLDYAPGYDVAVPRIGKYLEPLFAVYSKRCLPYVEFILKHDTPKITAFYDKVKVNYVGEAIIRSVADPDKVFFNINTPDDYSSI